MGSLAIRKVVYTGDQYYFESPTFEDGLSIIEGPNGTGKSTFFNLIYYGLGGRVDEFNPSSPEKHKEIIGDSNNMVRLVIEIDGELFTLNRRFRDNSITVVKASTAVDDVATSIESVTLPIQRREDVRTFSDWLLDRLNIPVVDIFQAGKQFKLNFSDLARLIYHNQSPDPNGIYKPAEVGNYISDSLEIRRAIFQILVGKTLLDLYNAIGRQKIAERDAATARSVHLEYQNIVEQLLKASGITDIANTKALGERIQDLETQIEALLATRKGFARGELGSTEAQQTLAADLTNIRALEVRKHELDEEREKLVREASRLIDVERSLQSDIERINKVIYAHGQLNLFSSDTCPYCLNDVARTPGHCVCGNTVEELDFQRFFYSPAEYLDILKTKSKSLETLRLAIASVREDSARWNLERAEVQDRLQLHRSRVQEANASPASVEHAIEELDAKLLDARDRLAKATEAYRLEAKLAELLKRYNNKKAAFDLAKAEVARLDGESATELHNQIEAFDRVYNDSMTSVVSECRHACIDSQTYLPLINSGEYREHSAKVPKRFLYYLALLQLSLLSDVPFPRLLLVDTPETAGIDFERLIKMLRQIELLENPNSRHFQILFSTGVKKYPPEFENNVVMKLTESARLLTKREEVANEQ
ncbi:ATP-binding protein [Achromobacter animicus]|uniref:ATP-binding protein n=1 Tax=Achromobacter animicus TaxID=1389935 RepID=UPI001468E68F|nr:ATP-binding protein [Achromobacter animicus]CAB3835675.1 hypothetical protein LMG26691_01210 [Achromobacter animicus]